MQDLLIPNTIPMPFANQGDKNNIPTEATGSQLASYQEGFPVITQTAIEQGGIPPERADFNGILNLQSQWQYAFQNGWLPTFNESVSAAIGGYAKDAVLWYYPTTGTDANRVIPLRSLTENNTYNFNTNAEYIGTYWGRVDGFITPEQLAQAIADIALPERLNGKADTDLSNVTKPYVTETYSSGKSWYRVWSDGWCEQGMTDADIPNNSTINFLKAFNGMPTFLIRGFGGDYKPVRMTSLSATKFSVSDVNYGDAIKLCSWYACGYIS